MPPKKAATPKAKKAPKILDNTGKVGPKYSPKGIKHSNFLITLNPNIAITADQDEGMYNKLKDSLKLFCSFVLDEKHLPDIIKYSGKKEDKEWFNKVKSVGNDKVAALETGATSGRPHCHIYLPIAHNTFIQMNLDALREIAEICFTDFGITQQNIKLDVRPEKNGPSGAEYVKKYETI